MRSVRELADAADAIGRGRLDQRVPVRGRDELADLAGSFNSMADQLRTRLLELELQRTRLRESISRTGSLLTASCQRSDGGSRFSAVDVGTCPGGRVGNFEGSLACE